MTRRAAFFVLSLNLIAIVGGVMLLVWAYSRTMPVSGITSERIDIAAARLAAQPSQAAIADVLHRDDSYIRLLQHIGEAQRRFLCWVIAGFMLIAVFNAFYVLPALRHSNRNA